MKNENVGQFQRRFLSHSFQKSRLLSFLFCQSVCHTYSFSRIKLVFPLKVFQLFIAMPTTFRFKKAHNKPLPKPQTRYYFLVLFLHKSATALPTHRKLHIKIRVLIPRRFLSRNEKFTLDTQLKNLAIYYIPYCTTKGSVE